ncbi:MAG: 16S rRNA (adenine(1518)-N(6)/adenine(1519)-N(6))-dimethyltransferase RsmA [Gammaproteobacteria bacterium]|nr:16S rRNA (adenine(1518)-N(6)/adenine(1519)-N(6))-dimethyltransferase RsmA [Gammaproteobacteria bacterium]
MGQHFLIDSSYIEKIIDWLALQSQDKVIEIGPGQGVLTTELLSTGAQVGAIEVDDDLVEYLRKKFSKSPNFSLHHMDALKFDYQAVSGDKIRVVGNLPYQISSPILFVLLSQMQHVQDMCFMLQHEFVERMVAKVGTKQYGRLSVMIQYACNVQKLFVVPATAFDPPPRVMSAVAYLTPKKSLPLTAGEYQLFSKLVATAFQQRRKMCRKVLQPFISADRLLELGIDPSVRPEQLSTDDYIRISQLIY